MGVAEAVRGKIDPKCVTRQCREGKCEVSIRDTPETSFAISMDHPQSPVSRHSRRCDFLFVGSVHHGGEEWIMPMELKAGEVKASEVAAQLRAGAEVADRLVPSGAKISFRPVVASGKIHKDERRNLLRRSNKINFRGKKEVIRRIRCGDPLTYALAASAVPV